MSEPISFRGYLHHWTLGEPPRLELVSLQADNAVALSIALLKGRELSLAIYWKEELVCTVAAALPPISTVIGKFSKCTKIKLDVYPRDMASFLGAIRLSENDGMMRFEVAPGGTLPEKPKREPKPSKEPTPYGAFWHEMDRLGFHNRPDVRAWLSVLWHDLEPKQAIRNQFQATSRASGISPDELLSVLRKFEMADAVSFVENIKAKTTGVASIARRLAESER